MKSIISQKRQVMLEAIAPICIAFGIKDYDYIVKESGQRETLKIYDTYIGCTYNSIDAVIDEIIGWLFVNRFCKNRYVGTIKTETLNCVKTYWIRKE